MVQDEMDISLKRKRESNFSMPQKLAYSPIKPRHLRSLLSAQLMKKGIITSLNIHPFQSLSLSLLILNTDNQSLHVNGFNSSLFNVAFYVEFHELLSLTRFTGNLFNSHPQALAHCHVTGSIEGSAVALSRKLEDRCQNGPAGKPNEH